MWAASSPRQGKTCSRVTGLWSSNDSPSPLGSRGWKKEMPPTGYTKKVYIVLQILPCQTYVIMRHKSSFVLPNSNTVCHFLVTSFTSQDCWSSFASDLNLAQWWQVCVWGGRDEYRVWFISVSQTHRPGTEFQPLWRWPCKWMEGQYILLLLIFDFQMCLLKYLLIFSKVWAFLNHSRVSIQIHLE